MKPFRRFVKALYIGFLFVSVFGCYFFAIPFFDNERGFPDDSKVDQSFITGQPCEAPCWYGLKLGESTVEDARTVVSELPFVDKPTMREGLFADGGSYLDFDCPYNDHCGSLFFKPNGKLNVITLSVMYELSIQTVIDQLSPPSNYIWSGNEVVCEISIYWPQKDFTIRILNTPGYSVCKNRGVGNLDLNEQVDQLLYAKISSHLIDQGIPWPDVIP